MKPDSGRPQVSATPAQRKVFDVTRPGRAQPNSTSKPVIVGHRPVVSDPSVTMNGVGAPQQISAHKKISIMSHDDTPVAAFPVPASSPAVPTLPPQPEQPVTPLPAPATPMQPIVPDVVAPAQPTSPVPEAPKPSVMAWAMPSAQSNQHDTAPLTSSLEPADVPPVATENTFADAVASDDDILSVLSVPAMDESPQAAVVSHQIGPKSFPWKLVVLLTIVIILAVALIDILLDADFISWNVPHTHFL